MFSGTNTASRPFYSQGLSLSGGVLEQEEVKSPRELFLEATRTGNYLRIQEILVEPGDQEQRREIIALLGKEGNLEVVTLCLGNDISLDDLECMVEEAAKEGHFEFVEGLLDRRRLSMGCRDRIILVTFRKLLSVLPDSVEYQTSLMRNLPLPTLSPVEEIRQLKVLKVILRNGDLSERVKRDTLQMASCMGFLSIIREITNSQPISLEERGIAILNAALGGRLIAIRELKKQQSTLSEYVIFQTTHNSMGQISVPVLQELLEVQGITNRKNLGALVVEAAKLDRFDIMELLQSDILLHPNDKKDAILHAVQNGNVASLKFLIRDLRGLSDSTMDELFDEAITIAIENKDLPIVDFLSKRDLISVIPLEGEARSPLKKALNLCLELYQNTREHIYFSMMETLFYVADR